MYVLAPGKRLDERGLSCHVGQDPELYLGVVGDHELSALRSGERVPDPHAHLCANRDILQVWRVAREAARSRPRLLQGAVYATILRDEFQETIYIGTPELGQLAVLDYTVGYGMLYSELLQNLRVRRIAGLSLSDGWYAHLFEEDLTELLGRPYVEGVADVFVDMLLQSRDASL